MASVKCSGGPGATMSVIGGMLVYDVADPVHPRLVCRSANTFIRLLDGNAIAYTTVVAEHVVIVRRDLTTGVESRIAQLRTDALPYSANWTSDGSLEVYATYGAAGANGRMPVQVHLWSNGADAVLYTTDAPTVGGAEGRWSVLPLVKFSPDHANVAISDSAFALYGSNLRIFSVADRRQLLVSAGAPSGGTWIANDRFAWATVSGSLMHWTPTGGAKVLRSEWWYGASSSSDGRWLAGTIFTRLGVDHYDTSNLRILIVPVGGGVTFTTGLGSSPGFVTPTVVWYAEEAPKSDASDPTWPNGTVHAFDVTNGTDQVVRFRAGEAPVELVCCAPRG